MSPSETTRYTQADLDRIQRRTLLIIVLSQAFGGAGLAAGLSVGALLAEDLTGSAAWSGVPSALFTLGAATTAFTVGRVTQSIGRRPALAIGFILAGIGAIGVITAAKIDQIWLLFASLFIYGAGTATNLQARYAGTDLAQPKKRATALSIAMVATTLGAVTGPNLISPLGKMAENWGFHPLTGPFFLSTAAFIIAGIVLLVFLRPDPFLLAQQHASQNESAPTSDILNQPAAVSSLVKIGAAVLIISHFVMVAVMTMTPVHMTAHDHDLSAVGFVISVHIGAMWLPSLFTGVLVDKIGSRLMSILGGIVLLSSGLLAAFSPAESTVLLTVALGLLGLGWNMSLVSGSTMVTDGTTPDNRAKTQGTIDVGVNIFGTVGGVTSGIMMTMTNYAWLAVLAGMIALAILPLVARTKEQELPRD